MSFQPGDRFYLRDHPDLTGMVTSLTDRPNIIYAAWDHRKSQGPVLYYGDLLVKLDEPDSNVPEEW